MANDLLAFSRRIWKSEKINEIFFKIYKRLGVRNEEFGESFYNKMIPAVLAECEAKGIVKLDKGAKCIYCPGF